MMMMIMIRNNLLNDDNGDENLQHLSTIAADPTLTILDHHCAK